MPAVTRQKSAPTITGCTNSPARLYVLDQDDTEEFFEQATTELPDDTFPI